jgi:hypothetical protein
MEEANAITRKERNGDGGGEREEENVLYENSKEIYLK